MPKTGRFQQRCWAKRCTVALFLLAAMFLAGILAPAAWAAKILVIHSYQPGQPWCDSIQAEFSRILGTEHDLSVHYLEMSQFKTQADRKAAADFFIEHLAHVSHGRFDLVLVADNDALDLVLKRREVIAPDIPVVFCGINNFFPAMLYGQHKITGVAECPSFTETLRLARTLRPELSKVMVLSADTLTGQGNVELFKTQMARDLPQMEYSIAICQSIQEAEARVVGLGPEWTVLQLASFFDGEQLLNSTEAARRISQTMSVPMLAVWDFQMGVGPLGGVLVSGAAQARAAADLATRILRGEDVATIPVLTESPNLIIVDHEVLQRFKMPLDMVPAEAVILNEPRSLYRENRVLIWVYAGITILVTLLAVTLALSRRRLRCSEQTLAEHLTLIRALMGAIPNPIFFKDIQGRYTNCNKAFVQYLGCQKEDLIGKTAHEIFSEQDAALMSDKEREMLASPGIQRFELNLRGPDNARWIVIHQDIAWDDKQEAIGIIGVFTDITELRLAEERLSLAVAGTNDGIWDWDRTSDMVYFSARWKEIIGYQPHEIANHSQEWTSRIHPDDKERVLAANNVFFEQHVNTFEVEYRIRHKDGDYRWILGRGICLRDEDGVPFRVVGSHSDITKRKKLEAELLEARDAAVAANQTKNVLLANMSHEIRTPLNGILGMLQLLEDSALNREQQMHVQLASSAAKSLCSLLSDILDLSRIETGNLTLEPRPFVLKGLLQALHDCFAMSARDKRIALDFTLEPDLPAAIVGDDVRLRQVLFNLIDNALKFTNNGTVSLSISTLPYRRDEKYLLLFCVNDTGSGMSDEMLNALFELLQQNGVDSQRQNYTSGLGMAIVKRLVEMMGGSINIDNESPGLSICFTVPVEIAEIETGLPEPNLDPDLESKPLRILLAEDDPISLIAGCSILEKAGHLVTPATDGGQALAFVRKRTFDVLLMDVQMPIIDGMEATSIIRTEPGFEANRHVPVIAITAYSMGGERERFLAAGMNGYMSKPLAWDKLESVLAEIRAKGHVGKI